MKQSDDPDKFFEKYGFRQTITKKHPSFKDPMHFEGLEADYVTTLEERIKSLEKYLQIQNDKIDFLMNKEIYKYRDSLRQDKEGK